MSPNACKRVLEFFLRSAPEVSGQMLADVPDLRKRWKRFVEGRMTVAERADFFIAVHMNPKAVELLAREIQRQGRAGQKKQKSPCRIRRRKKQ